MSGSALGIVAAAAGTLGFFMGFLSLLLLWKRSKDPSEEFRKLFFDFLEKTDGERKLSTVGAVGRKQPDSGGAGFSLGDKPCGNKYDRAAGSRTGAALRIGEIMGMVSAGMGAREIAEGVGMPRGEIDLILKLRKR